jgi:hypothetical protein
MTDSKQTTSATPAEKPPEPTAADVAKVSGQLVSILQGLSPQMQIRALTAAATLLGVDKEQRSRSGSSQQQRSNNNSNRSQQR